MTTYARLKVASVVFDPQAPGTQPNGSLFMDSSNSNALTTKTTGGSNTQVGASSSSDTLIKSKKNTSGSTIPAKVPICISTVDGSILRSDSDAASRKRAIGITLEEIANDAFGNCQMFGPNVVDAVADLEFTPGLPVFVGKTTPYTQDLNTFEIGVDSIIRIGYADVASGQVGSEATDLILFAEEIALT